MISALLKPSIVINGKKYKIMKQIGEGGFAFVYDVRGTGKESGEHFALKKMICQTDEQLDEAKKEIDTLGKLKNPHVLELLDFAYSLNKKNQKEALLLLPLYQGSVQTIIDNGHGYPHCGFADGLDVLKILRHIIEGLKAIHAAGLRHADLKPANILLTDAHHAVITDFGSVSPFPVTIRSRTDALIAQDKAASCTTASYRAPELYNTPSECVLGGESDVWSLGCLIYCIFYSRSPFESAAEGLSTLSIVSAHYVVPESNLWPAEYLEVIAQCLRAEPAQRASLDSLQAQLQSIPCPPLDTTLTVSALPPLVPPHTIHASHVNNTASASNANAVPVVSSDAAARLNNSTSTTSSAVSTSHLEFSETNSFPTTPVTPGMAVNFADFPDFPSVIAGGAPAGSGDGGDGYVLSRLSDAGSGIEVEFASGSALSEILLEERAAGSVYGSAYASSSADSYVHADETLSNCSSGEHSPFEHTHHGNSNSSINMSQHGIGVVFDNLPASVPVRKGLSTPTTHLSHLSHDSFDFVEHSAYEGSANVSVSCSTPHTLRTASDDNDSANFAAFPAFPAVASSTAALLPLPLSAQRAVSVGIAEQAQSPQEVEWHDGDPEAFQSDDEEFGEFTASATTYNTSAAIALSSSASSADSGTSVGGKADSNSQLQEVDLWRLITAQAQLSQLSNSVNQGRRHVIKEGAVCMMRQGGFPKRWAKKQVWLVLTPLGLILRKDSAPDSRIHEVLSLHRPLHATPSDTLQVGLHGVRVEGSAPVVLGRGSEGSGSGKREKREEGDWIKVSVSSSDISGDDKGVGITGTSGTANTNTSDTTDTGASSSVGKCLFVRASFEVSFEDKDVLNEWLDALEEQRDMLLLP